MEWSTWGTVSPRKQPTEEFTQFAAYASSATWKPPACWRASCRVPRETSNAPSSTNRPTRCGKSWAYVAPSLVP